MLNGTQAASGQQHIHLELWKGGSPSIARQRAAEPVGRQMECLQRPATPVGRRAPGGSQGSGPLAPCGRQRAGERVASQVQP